MVTLTLIQQTLETAPMIVHFIIKLLDNIRTFWNHLILYVPHISFHMLFPPKEHRAHL